MATPPVSDTSAAREEHSPTSLTDWLRSRSDDELADLLRRRPDLALPAPADLAMLASRLSVRTSVQRAIDTLDAFTLRVLDAMVLGTPHGDAVDLAGAEALLGAVDDAELHRAVDDLQRLGLLWGRVPRLHLVATVREAIGSYPAGLGRRAADLFRVVPDLQLAPVLRALGLPPARQPEAAALVADVLSDPRRVRDLVEQSDADEREVLERLAAGPPIGTVRNARITDVDAGTGRPAPHRLIARGLLVPIDAQTVELPREIGVAVRSAPLGDVDSAPPDVPVTPHAPAELDRTGTTAVLDVLRLVVALADTWVAQPPPMLRSGGVGVRELRRTARDLGVDESTAAVVTEVAYAAGLLGSTNGIDPVYLPTPEYDEWLQRDTSARWADLATAWLGMSRQPSLVSQRSDRDRLIPVLGPDVERGAAPALRRQVLDALTPLPPGASPRRREDVLARLVWQNPRRAPAQRALLAAMLAEADLLGVTAAGGLTGYSRTLLAGSRAAAEQVLATALPDPVESIVVQPDLTVVVPGPPVAELARELALVADLESSGGASVYRITESSIRRALDAGRSAGDLRRMLDERSRTPIPQALTYLIDDIARRHGLLRAGAASSYLRCDDEALLARVLADRAVESAHLRRIAPTVVVSDQPPNRVLEVLRAAGFAPAAEAPGGDVITLGGDAPRAPSRTGVRVIRPRAALENDAQLRELVRRIRSGDSLTELTRTVHPVAQQVPGVTSASTLETLRQAIRDGRRVLLGHADPDGTASRHTILPISLMGGFVRGHAEGSQRLQSFALHRLTAVRVLDDPDDDDLDGDYSDGDYSGDDPA